MVYVLILDCQTLTIRHMPFASYPKAQGAI